MTKRNKHVFNTGEIPHLWAHHTQDEARNRQGNLYFVGDTIYSYGSHFPIARQITNDAGQRAILFTTGLTASPPQAIAPRYDQQFPLVFLSFMFQPSATDAMTELILQRAITKPT